MQIGEIIRKYRKEKDMTQEEMAGRLGVTAPAVNKWENGNSLPDIMLLAPIARLLGITVDELLSFREELTDDEIASFVRELNERLKKEPYEVVFCWAKEKLEQYPNSEQLIWQTAVILDAWMLTKEDSDSDEYEEYICECYRRVLNSDDEKCKTAAADSLFAFHCRKGQYEKAEEFLQYFSEQNPERKRKQAMIYGKTNRMPEAYKAYEELLFSDYQRLSMVLSGLYLLAMEEKNLQKAHLYVDKHAELAKLFEMGKYQEASAKLELAVVEKDVEMSIQIMEKMLASIDTLSDFSKSPLYEHMTFKEISQEFVVEMKQNLVERFKDEETFGFLQQDERWKELVGGK